MKKMIVAVFCTCLWVITSGNPVANDCKPQLRKVFAREKEFIQQTLRTNNCWYLRYTMQNVVINPNTHAQEKMVNEGEMFATNDLRIVKSNGLEVFMDRQDIFTVNTKKKTVLQTQTPKGAFTEAFNNHLVLLQDSILQGLNVVSCIKMHEKGMSLTRYDLKPINTARSMFEKISIYADVENNDLIRMEVWFNPKEAKELLSYVMIISQRKSIDIPIGWSTAKNQLFDKDNRFRGSYKHYTYKQLKS